MPLPLALMVVVLVMRVPESVVMRWKSSMMESTQGPQVWSVVTISNLSLWGGDHWVIFWMTVPRSEMQRLSEPIPPAGFGSSQDLG